MKSKMKPKTRAASNTATDTAAFRRPTWYSTTCSVL